MRVIKVAMLMGVFSPMLVSAQQTCANASRIDGIITDATGAIIPRAQVQASDGETATSDAAGRYVLPCAPAGTVTFNVQAQGFEVKSQSVRTRPGQPLPMCSCRLQPCRARYR